MAMKFGKDFVFGQKVEGTTVPKFKLADKEKKYFSIISFEDAVVSLQHYVKGAGTFRCLTTQDEDGLETRGECCKLLDELSKHDDKVNPLASEKINVPIAVYTLVKDGEASKLSEPINFCNLALNFSDYNQIVELMQARERDDIANKPARTEIAPEQLSSVVFSAEGKEASFGEGRKYVALTFDRTAVRSPLITDASIQKQARDFILKWREKKEGILGKLIPADKLVSVLSQTANEAGVITTKKAAEPPAPFVVPPAATTPPVIEPLSISSIDLGDISMEDADSILDSLNFDQL